MDALPASAQFGWRVTRRDAQGAAWEEAGHGLPRGCVDLLVTHPLDPDLVYARVAEQGLWRTTTGGR